MHKLSLHQGYYAISPPWVPSVVVFTTKVSAVRSWYTALCSYIKATVEYQPRRPDYSLSQRIVEISGVFRCRGYLHITSTGMNYREFTVFCEITVSCPAKLSWNVMGSGHNYIQQSVLSEFEIASFLTILRISD